MQSDREPLTPFIPLTTPLRNHTVTDLSPCLRYVHDSHIAGDLRLFQLADLVSIAPC